MEKIKPSQLKIGTKLYQYSNQILEYDIIGINELKTDKHTQVFYILKCLSCRGHIACEVAIKFNDYKDLEYSHMINGYENDDDYYKEHEHYSNSQYYWHRNKDYYWFLTRKEARLFAYNKSIKYYEEQIKNAEASIILNNNFILKEKDKINALTED